MNNYDQQVCAVLKEKIMAQITRYHEVITAGQATDWAEYKKQCGVISGLTLALEEVEALAKNIQEDNDE